MQVLVALLLLPLTLLNLFGGLVSGGWLLALGDWRPVLIGIGVMIVSPFPLGLLVMPAMIFGLPAANLMEKGRTILAFPFAVLGLAYIHLVVGAWYIVVFVYSMKFLTSENFWPMLVWSFSVASAPWSYMAQNDMRSGSGDGAFVTVFFAQIAYIAMVGAAVFRGGSLYDLAFVFGVVMAVSVVVQSFAAAVMSWAARGNQGALSR